ncbi:MAG: hypothetical protein KIT60_28575 [Burkholderiaceae bacterium]|nr:hypothetical protein [Burkholderiaceae bacterium]
MSLFSRNEARREHGSRLSTADMAAAREAQHTQPMDNGRQQAAALHAEAHREEQGDRPHARRDAEVEDAVVVTREPPRQTREQREERVRSTAANERGERLAALFGAEAAHDFRTRWDATQIGFVDDPRRAVQQADELVAEVMQSLAQSFADERQQLEAEMRNENASTESLRVALQRYRSFFQRMLSL